MRLFGHTIIGTSIAISFLDEKNVFNIYTLILCGTYIIGNIFPDYFDRVLSLGNHEFWRKIHRTFSHWIWFYFLILSILIFQTKNYTSDLAIFFLAGCVTHCIVDLFSPSGVPFLSPFGERVSLNLVKNRSLLEVILPIVLISLVILMKLPFMGTVSHLFLDNF